MKISQQKQIDTILDNFGFESVRKAMVALNWTWVTSNQDDHIPSIAEARSCARELLNEVANCPLKETYIGTGGFVATKESGNRLSLRFSVEDMSGNDFWDEETIFE
jgi:hypothetical protein